MPEAEPRPEFADTTRHKIGVFIQIGGSMERANFLRVIETMEIEHFALGDFFEERANLITIGHLQVLERFQTIWQRFNKCSFGRMLLQRCKRSDKIDNDTPRSFALNRFR